MKINGINVSEYSARLIDRVCSTQNIKSITDWLDGAVQGTLLRQDYEYKSMKVTFVVTEENEDKAYKQISKLTEALKKCCVKFDDIDLMFPCVLYGAATPNRLQNGVFRIDYVLLNDWGIGDAVELSFDIEAPQAQELKIKYIENWATTAKGYSKCFDKDEIYVTIAEETVYIESGKVVEVAATADSWNSFFLALGVDIDKYRKENYQNGFIHITEDFSAEKAATLFDSVKEFEVYYNRFQKNGYPDLPLPASYPSLVWMMADNPDTITFDLGVGKGWNIQDITLNIWGRWYDSAGSGCMFGASTTDNYCLSLTMPKAVYKTGDINPKEAKVFDDSTKGGKVIIQTLEDIDATPLRKYGFKSSNDGAAAVKGFVDVIFNGVTLDRTQAKDTELQGNIILMNGDLGKGKYIEIARVQVFYKGELVKDLIPIAENVKNGFVNTYSQGFYDINTFEFIGWNKANGDKGDVPPAIMTIPIDGDTPKPPTPPTPKYTVTVVNGSGSGEYEAGTYVSIVADEAPSGKEFAGWAVTSGNVTIITPNATSTGFIMPEADVTVTAAYEDVKITPEILLYNRVSDMANEETMGANKKSWSDGVDPYDYFVAVYSVPNSGSGQWSIYNSSYYSKSSQGTDKWGRSYIEFEVTRGKSATGQYIIHTDPDDGEVRADFKINSF